MKNKLFKTMTHVMLITTGIGFVAPLAQPLSVFAEEKTEVKSESLDLTKAIDDAKAAGVSVKMGETKLFQSREELDTYVKDTIAKLKNVSVKASELKKARSQEDEAYKKAKAEYDKKLKSYTEGLAKFQKDQQDLTKRNDILSSKDGIVVYGKYDEANKGSVKYFGQIGVGLSDYNKYPNLSFVILI